MRHSSPGAALAVLFSLCVMPATAAPAEELRLVDAGVCQVPIILTSDAPPFTREAADELARCIEQTSGARPEILAGVPDKLQAQAIWIGSSPEVRKLFPQIDFDFRHPEEIVIAASANHLVLAGRDRWDPRHLVVQVADSEINGRQQEYGTANAVYTFLQKYLGVRWLWPGELGEDFAERKTIAFAPFEYHYHPQIRARGGVFNFSSLGNRGYGRSHQWTRRQRLQLDSLELAGGHAFTDWWERFHESHREYFALQPDGTRSGFPNPRTVKLCQSNPAVWSSWLEDVQGRLKADPLQTVFSGAPNDGWASGHCVCEDCSAWDHPAGEQRRFHWQGRNGDRPALSDRDVTFANRLAEQLEEKFPEQQYFVLMNAYGHSRPAPIKAVPADNVIISSVANFLGRRGLADRGSSRGTTHREQFAAWGKVARHLMWRPNTGSPGGWQQGMPDLSLRQTMEDLKFVADNRCIGIFIDSVWEHWATQGPQYYVMAQLVWNPAADGEAVLKDYYARGFGPAADSVEAYFNLLEQARQAYVKQAGPNGGGREELTSLYTDELLNQAGRLLDQAAEAVAESPEKYRQRVEFIRAGHRYTRLMAENIRLMTGYWDRAEKSPSVEQQEETVRGNWQAIEQLGAAQPYAINWRALRPQTPRMVGLHPDHPDPKRKQKQRKKARTANDLDQD